MEGIDAYILSVTAAAILCGIATQLADSKGMIGRLTRLICGVIMTVVIARPLSKPIIPDFTGYFRNMEAQVSDIVNVGVMDTREQLSARIIREAESYILEKAEQLGCVVEVSVILNGDDPPVPAGVIVQGSPPSRIQSTLAEIIENDLGIRKEDQIWK